MGDALDVVVAQTVLAGPLCLALRRETRPRLAGRLALEIVFVDIFVASSALMILAQGSCEFWPGPELQLYWIDVVPA